jgi:hypothetical protein
MQGTGADKTASYLGAHCGKEKPAAESKKQEKPSDEAKKQEKRKGT